jgi:DnaJ like chaperone protein
MGISGKILGSAAGFAIGGPLGALMGVAAGHAYDRFRDEQREAETGEPSLAKQTAFAIAIIALCAKMAKADGFVSRSEIDAFKEVFHIAPGEEDHVRLVFDLARRDARGFEPYAKQIARMFRDNPAVLEQLLAGLIHIAAADGKANAEEIAYLRRVAAIFGFDENRFEQVRAAHLGADPDDPYRVLGVARSANDDEIRAAWHKLLREHHPDALVAQGMPEDFVRVATRRVAAVNAAYDRIREQRGIP